MSKRQFFKAYLSALYAGDAATLRKLRKTHPQNWKENRLNFGAVSKVLDGRALSPAAQREALKLEARKLHSEKVECACVYSAMFAFLGAIMAGFPSSFVNSVDFFVVLGVNLAFAFLYLYLSNRAKDAPKFCGRLAFAIATGVWFYNHASGDAGGLIPLILTSFALRYEEPRQRKTPSQTPPQRPTKKRRKKI